MPKHLKFLYNTRETGIQLFRHGGKLGEKEKLLLLETESLSEKTYVDFLSKFLLEELQRNDTRRSNLMKKEQMH